MTLDLSIDINKEGPVTIFAIKGELDDFNAPKLSDAFTNAIEKEKCKKMVVDLDGTTFIDSVGLGTIAIAGKKIVKQEGKMNIVCNKSTILKLINASGIINAVGVNMKLVDSVDQAKVKLS